MTAEIISFRGRRARRGETRVSGLVTHDGEQFHYVQLLLHTPHEFVFAAMASGASVPQQWWDELARRWPTIAEQTIAECRCSDAECC